MTDEDRIVNITAELRSAEMLRVLRHAVRGDMHWRIEAQRLLDLVDGGVLPLSYYHDKHKDAV